MFRHNSRRFFPMVLLALLIGSFFAPLADAQTAVPPAAAVPVTPSPTPDLTRLERTENFLVLGADVRPGPG